MRVWTARWGVVWVLVVTVAGCDAAGGAGQPDAVADTEASDVVGSSDAVADDVAEADTMAMDDAVATDDAMVSRDTTSSEDTVTAAEDTASSEDTSSSEDTTAGAMCPPTGPFGTDVGDVLADLTLYDCDGIPHRIADLCGRPASILTSFAGWCPVCRGDAAHANADYEGFRTKAPGFEWFFVITAPDAANAMTPEYCAAIREDYGLTMPVLLDADGIFPAHIGVTSTNAWTVALDADGVILAKDHYDESNAFAKVNAQLQ